MTYIHKIKLDVADKQVIIMPYATGVLDIQVQNGEIVMWYYFDDTLQGPFSNKERWEILFYGTGNPIDTLVKKQHLKSIQFNGYVWHIFIQN